LGGLGHLRSSSSSDLLESLSAPARLALAYAPRAAKPEWLDFLALDARLARIVRDAREPLVAQIRLAWWRERLAEPAERWPTGEPLLDSLRQWRDPARLAALVDAWEPLLADGPQDSDIDDAVEARAQACLGLARELAVPDEAGVAAAGRLWALAELASRVAGPAVRGPMRERAAKYAPPPAMAAALRPLAVLANLSAASLARGGGPLLAGPGSLLLALRTGLTGR
jgi:phytoene synthase